jgi:uncharacterized protein with HEPN domain
MKHDVKVWLEDISNAIREIFEFLPEPLNYSDFENDLKTRKAVERNIEIIGEALNRILKTDPEISISDSRKIVDTRNRIIHGYDSVTADILWLIIQKSLPILKSDIESLLE